MQKLGEKKMSRWFDLIRTDTAYAMILSNWPALDEHGCPFRQKVVNCIAIVLCIQVARNTYPPHANFAEI